jgi:hypothetical protein
MTCSDLFGIYPCTAQQDTASKQCQHLVVNHQGLCQGGWALSPAGPQPPSRGPTGHRTYRPQQHLAWHRLSRVRMPAAWAAVAGPRLSAFSRNPIRLSRVRMPAALHLTSRSAPSASESAHGRGSESARGRGSGLAKNVGRTFQTNAAKMLGERFID